MLGMYGMFLKEFLGVLEGIPKCVYNGVVSVHLKTMSDSEAVDVCEFINIVYAFLFFE